MKKNHEFEGFEEIWKELKRERGGENDKNKRLIGNSQNNF